MVRVQLKCDDEVNGDKDLGVFGIANLNGDGMDVVVDAWQPDDGPPRVVATRIDRQWYAVSLDGLIDDVPYDYVEIS